MKTNSRDLRRRLALLNFPLANFMADRGIYFGLDGLQLFVPRP